METYARSSVVHFPAKKKKPNNHIPPPLPTHPTKKKKLNAKKPQLASGRKSPKPYPPSRDKKKKKAGFIWMQEYITKDITNKSAL